MSFGWHNPWPLEWGGGPTEVERAWAALRHPVGKGGAAANLESVDGVWREARAIALAALRSAGERAALQAWPSRATDFLEWYERVLLLQPGANDHEVKRRDAVTALWTKEIRSTVAEITEQLRAIHEDFVVLAHTWEESDTTYPGKTFQDLDGSPIYGRAGTNFPAYSSRFVHYVELPLGDGALPSATEIRAAELAAAMLDEVLPAWETFELLEDTGFNLDISRLDATGFGA